MQPPALTPLAAAALRVGTPERALAIGCGEGDAVLFLAREFPAARVRGVDRSEQAVRAAQARIGLDPEGRVAFKVAPARRVPYPDGFFDLVVVLAGRPAPAEIVRVLRPGGHLILVSSHRRGQRQELADALLWRRLGRRGVAALHSADAGDGSFSVGRLRSEGDVPAAD